MKIDQERFIEQISQLALAGGGKIGVASSSMAKWIDRKKLPPEVVDFFKRCSPKSEIWVGAGSLFNENGIMKWNDDFPQALDAGLLIIGTCGNGDHIVMNFKKNGSIAFLSHEDDWGKKPQSYLATISDSIGQFLEQSNSEESDLPNDYWEAIARNRE